jgi:GTPase
MSETKHIDASVTMKNRYDVFDASGCDEITCATIGSVDSGKSTTVGVLCKNMYDDGRGSARTAVMKHQHEFRTGNTSDIAYQYFKDDNRIYTFIDLAGHEDFLRTTISGLSSGYPDVAICCVSDKVTNMTKEHILLAINLGIPIIINFTKTDLVPVSVTKGLMVLVKYILQRIGRRMFKCKSAADFLLVRNSDKHIPFILTSNKNGTNIDLIREILGKVQKRKRQFIDGFVIDAIYNITGIGTVVSGQVGHTIEKADVLYIGPMSSGKFIKVRVKTMHNDYRYSVDVLNAGTRGCLCIAIDSKDRRYLRKGMLLRHEIPHNICSKFEARVLISHHHTSISNGYQAYVNCGLVSGACVLSNIKVLDKKINNTSTVARSDDIITCDITFMCHLNYVEIGQKIVFRGGMTKGVGVITNIYPYKNNS